jgi:hypothetical protein
MFHPETHLTMERSTSASTPLEIATGTSNPPFWNPVVSASTSSTGFSSARDLSNLPRSRYYHSRRIRKDENYVPPIFKKHPGENWLWINPLIGFIAGLAISGYIVYTTVSGKSYNYCPVLDEDFSSAVLNPRIWTMEVEVGGFGYV